MEQGDNIKSKYTLGTTLWPPPSSITSSFANLVS